MSAPADGNAIKKRKPARIDGMRSPKQKKKPCLAKHKNNKKSINQ